MTYTYVVMDVSRAAFDEIAAKMRAAGYDHVFHEDVIDMHGIAVKATDVYEPTAEIVKENGTSPQAGNNAIALARRVVDLLGRCQLYGPADALRDTAARLLTVLVDQGSETL
jgi:hypothetical protein